MGKLERLNRDFSRNAEESIGATKRPAVKVADAGPRAPRAVPDESAYAIPLDLIDNDEEQPRTRFDEDKLNELAESLKSSGQLQPCLVSPTGVPGHYVLVSGERRFRAAYRAGLATLLCRIAPTGMTAQDVLIAQLAENLQRDDFNPVDKADGLARLRDDYGLSTRQIAERLGISQSDAARSLALADLQPAVKTLVADDGLAASTALAIATLKDARLIREFAARAVAEGWTRERAETLVRSHFLRTGSSPAPAEPIDGLLSHGDSPRIVSGDSSDWEGAIDPAKVPDHIRDRVNHGDSPGPASPPTPIARPIDDRVNHGDSPPDPFQPMALPTGGRPSRYDSPPPIAPPIDDRVSHGDSPATPTPAKSAGKAGRGTDSYSIHRGDYWIMVGLAPSSPAEALEALRNLSRALDRVFWARIYLAAGTRVRVAGDHPDYAGWQGEVVRLDGERAECNLGAKGATVGAWVSVEDLIPTESPRPAKKDRGRP